VSVVHLHSVVGRDFFLGVERVLDRDLKDRWNCLSHMSTVPLRDLVRAAMVPFLNRVGITLAKINAKSL
jgi:hypothetical protein